MNLFQNISTVFFLFFSLSCKSQKTGFAISSDKTPVFYRTFGSGKPLLIINGGPGMNSDGFENLALKLSKNNQTIIYDQRGTGKSTLEVIDTTNITMKLMMDDIESLRNHLKIEKWSILGHSFGGIVASYYATQYPDHIERLILSSSGGINLDLLGYVGESINSRLSKGALDSVSYWTKKINDGDTSYFAKLERGKNLAPAYLFDKKFVPTIAERLTQGNSLVNQLIWSDLQKINYDCTEKLHNFEKPVLIIQGKQDVIKAETADKAHKILKNSKVVFMDHCGHYGWLDNDTVYFSEIDSFLARIK